MKCDFCKKEVDSEKVLYLRFGTSDVNGKAFYFCNKDCLLGFILYRWKTS